MAAIGDFLRRFRFHGVPGAPTAVGIPTDHATELEHELAPVFAALDDAQRRAAAIVPAAEEAAATRRAEASAEGRRLVAVARADAPAARAEAFAARMAQTEVEVRQVLDAGEAEATRVTSVATERLPALVDRVVAYVLALAPPEDGGAT